MLTAATTSTSLRPGNISRFASFAAAGSIALTLTASIVGQSICHHRNPFVHSNNDRLLIGFRLRFRAALFLLVGDCLTVRTLLLLLCVASILLSGLLRLNRAVRVGLLLLCVDLFLILRLLLHRSPAASSICLILRLLLRRSPAISIPTIVLVGGVVCLPSSLFDRSRPQRCDGGTSRIFAQRSQQDFSAIQLRLLDTLYESLGPHFARRSSKVVRTMGVKGLEWIFDAIKDQTFL
jgi:hypothetical protein